MSTGDLRPGPSTPHLYRRRIRHESRPQKFLLVRTIRDHARLVPNLQHAIPAHYRGHPGESHAGQSLTTAMPTTCFKPTKVQAFTLISSCSAELRLRSHIWIELESGHGSNRKTCLALMVSPAVRRRAAR